MRPETFSTGELKRTRDADAVNAVINAPEVRPFVGGEGYLDISDVIARNENVVLFGEHGGFLLTWSAPGVYEVHTFITKGGRGRWARDAARETIRYAAHTLLATQLWTRIKDQLNVRAFAVEMGMRSTLTEIDGHEILSMRVG